MKYFLLVLAGLGAAALITYVVLQSPAGNPEPTSTAAKQVEQLEVDGMTREFIVYRPRTLDADEEVPVVFMFHGSGQGGQMFYEESQWKEKADEEGFMAVFPTALKYHVFNEEKVIHGEVEQDVAVYQTKWNDFGLVNILDPDFPNQTLYDDTAFVQAMVDFLDENYAVDADRFYATGFSNGAGFTVRLAVEMTDVFAAFAPTGAGRVKEGVIENLPESFEPRPVIQMIGELDPKLTYAAGVEGFTMDESAATPGDVIKDYVIDPYLSLLEMEETYTYERTNRVSHFTYAEPIADNQTQTYHLLIVEGMKHVYPNGTNFPVTAVDIFWPFFEQYSL